MKFIKVSLLISILYLLPLGMKAQWYKLPHTGAPMSWRFYPNITTPYQNIYPASNGQIIYDIYSNSGSNDPYGVMESYNDLSLDTIKFFESNTGCCQVPSMVSANDSTHAFIVYVAGIPTLYYTSTDFSIVAAKNAYLLPFGGPLALTKNYIYVASQNSGMFNDSILINKTKISFNTYQYKGFYADSGVGKLIFVNDSTGFMLTYQRLKPSLNMLIKTIDYGITWNTVFNDSTSIIKDYCFPTKDTGYIITSNDSLFKTIDGGTTWNKLSALVGLYTSIHFANGKFGYIGGRGGFLIKTIDGGISWTTEISNTTKTILSIYTFGSSVAYFVDSVKEVYKNQPPLGMPSLTSSSEYVNIYPNPSHGIYTIERSAEKQSERIEIYNVLGEKALTLALSQTGEGTQIDISDKPSGIYFYRIITESGSLVGEGKLIKE